MNIVRPKYDMFGAEIGIGDLIIGSPISYEQVSVFEIVEIETTGVHGRSILGKVKAKSFMRDDQVIKVSEPMLVTMEILKKKR